MAQVSDLLQVIISDSNFGSDRNEKKKTSTANKRIRFYQLWQMTRASFRFFRTIFD